MLKSIEEQMASTMDFHYIPVPHFIATSTSCVTALWQMLVVCILITTAPAVDKMFIANRVALYMFISLKKNVYFRLYKGLPALHKCWERQLHPHCA